MTTKQCLMELKKLAATTRENIYRRVELAATVLGDLDWIAVEHGGDEFKAHDAVQNEFFPDLDGYVSLGKLIDTYQNFPKPKWEEYRFNVAAVVAAYDEQRSPGEERAATTRIAWKQVAEERTEELARTKAKLGVMEDLSTRQTAELTALREENARLRGETERLRGRIEELERIVHRDQVAA